MHQVFKWFWNAAGVAFQCWSIIGFVRAWVSGDTVVFGTYSMTGAFVMQTYAALAIGAAIFLILFNRHAFMQWRERIHANRPDARLKRLCPSIRSELYAIDADTRSSGEEYADRQKLALALEDLGINAPDAANDDEWYGFVASLLPLAEHRRLEDARLLLARLREQEQLNR